MLTRSAVDSDDVKNELSETTDVRNGEIREVELVSVMTLIPGKAQMGN